MRRLAFGVSVLAFALGLGCGKTHAPSGPQGGGGSEVGAAGDGTSGTPGGGATAGSSGVSGSASKAGNGGGASAGATSSGGAAGGSTLPPDGPIPPAAALHKLDLLLMVDNSRNTAEKQRLLKDAVDWLLKGGAKLAADDIHVGVVTSSLGSHGATGTGDVCTKPTENDHAQLLGVVRPGLTTFKQSGFLAWGPAADPSIDTVIAELDPMIDAAGELGCGYEASLEAWYRFLVDPSPPGSILVDPSTQTARVTSVDEIVLAQRKAFLRSDSVLAIVMVTDENDCSVQDQGYGWLIARAAPNFRSTSACVNPNDACCQSCGEASTHPGCPPIANDSECVKGSTLAQSADNLNLRCFDQKRRFGFDLLYPISRYTDALTRQTAWGSDGEIGANPIFVGLMRHPSQVILTGIVGVPWQDLADKASLTGAGLTNLTAAELLAQDRWKVIVGDPTASPPERPTDPFMIEADYDRAMLSSVHANPISGDVLVPSTSMDPQANKINGHESAIMGQDLQAACIFPLGTPKVCDTAAHDAGASCRCYATDSPINSALCQPPAAGSPTTTQSYEQASPGIRHLQLLQSLGDNAVTASACPKVTTPDAADYGYRPAMKALAARLERAFNP